MTPFTICFTYFKSLGLANLGAALYSVRQQDLTHVEKMVIIDNDTGDQFIDILHVVESLAFPMPVVVQSSKHGDSNKTHSWSSNVAVRAATTEWVFFTRADYILDFGTVSKFVAEVDARQPEWNGFITGHTYHLYVNLAACGTAWREHGTSALRRLPGVEEDYTCIDAGVWMARRDAFEQVGGLDESLTAWGHAQTHFQYKLYIAGVEFVRIPQPLFFHPEHGGQKDIAVAHQQLRDLGINIRDMWARHPGVQPY